MGLSDKIEQSIDRWSEKWKDKLRGWLLRSIAEGATKFLEDEEPAAIANVTDMITKVRANPNTPPEVRDMLDKIEGRGSWIMLVLGIAFAIPLIIQAINSVWLPGTKQMTYGEERVAKTFRLDPIAVITAWRRDKVTYEKYFDDLKDQGWSDDRIEALKFVTLFMPGALDIVSWYAKEVYEPDMVERYGLEDELPEYETTDFPKIGVDSTQARNYWMAHWEHASFMQVIEMLHRGLLTLDKTMQAPPTTKEGWDTRDADGEKALYDWYRLVEIPPFWRARLTAMSWNVPTRVDVRRWWDMRTIDEQELRNIYHRQGYHGKDLENYIKWTKVYTDFPLMMTRFSNGWITEEDIRTWLRGLEIPEDRIEQFIQEKTKPELPARTTKEKDLTKTEIYKGVKKKLISWGQGIELLMDMGYSEDEADYILAVNVGVLEGSPETFAEFKDLTTKYKIAAGKEVKPMPEELKQAAAEVVRLTGEVEALQRSIEEEKAGLIDEEVLPGETTAHLEELQVSLHRAEAELARVKSEYSRLLAEWRHGTPE